MPYTHFPIVKIMYFSRLQIKGKCFFHNIARVSGFTCSTRYVSIIGENRLLIMTKNIDFLNYRTQQPIFCFAIPPKKVKQSLQK